MSNINKELIHGEYQDFNYPDDGKGYTIIQGVRQKTNSSDVYIAGTYAREGDQKGLLYTGSLSGNGYDGKWDLLDYDNHKTSIYGVNNIHDIDDTRVILAGSFIQRPTGKTVGLLGFHDVHTKWQELDPTEGEANKTFVHSVMGSLAVGNYDLGDKVYSFIYNYHDGLYETFLVSGSSQTTLYGIWCNSHDSYTVCGGCVIDGIPTAFISDINKKGKEIKTIFFGSLSHAQGITSNGMGGYNLAVNSLINGNKCKMTAINRNSRGELNTLNTNNYSLINDLFSLSYAMSSNTIIGDNVLGIYKVNVGSRTVPISYLAKFNI